LRSTSVNRRGASIAGPGPLTFGRGLEIAVTVRRTGVRRRERVPAGSVLNEYLARHVSMNTFIETVLRSQTRGEINSVGCHDGARRPTAVAFFARLAEAPHRADFYHTLRQVECLYPDRPRLGRARRPADEGIRHRPGPDLSFAPTPVAALETGGARRACWSVCSGCSGPNGPMPIHLTEYARERLRNAGDPTLAASGRLQPRFLSFLYQRGRRRSRT
jgi:hypothetical protein